MKIFITATIIAMMIALSVGGMMLLTSCTPIEDQIMTKPLIERPIDHDPSKDSPYWRLDLFKFSNAYQILA